MVPWKAISMLASGDWIPEPARDQRSLLRFLNLRACLLSRIWARSSTPLAPFRQLLLKFVSLFGVNPHFYLPHFVSIFGEV